ncbi:MAG: S24 family peptidase, partial [Clostridia bacterium]
GCRLDDFDDALKPADNKKHLSRAALRTARLFDDLDTHGQRAVNAVLDVEHDRCSMPAPVARPLPINVIKMQVYDDPAAAGIPIYAESACEYMDFPEDDVPSGADFGIRISGDSMEPTVRDGQIVWIKSQPELYDGQVGVFMLDGGEAVCKRARVRDDGRVFALESDNPKYAPIEGSDLEGLRVVGRVLL